MSDLDRRFHELWLGMAQPIEGLVLSVPVLVDAQCVEKQPPQVQQQWREHLGEPPVLRDFERFARELLGYPAGAFDTTLPEALKLDVVEGHQTLKPTRALKRQGPAPAVSRGGLPDDSTPASRAGDAYLALVWELPEGLDLDKRETKTGAWDAAPTDKFDRLLRACRVPIGLLTNGHALRLFYAPHGESSGHVTFRFSDLLLPGGRPLLDALVMLLHARRFFSVADDCTLPALLAASRKRQANVTEALATQVFEALGILLTGFEGAAERDATSALDEAMRRGEEHVYGGLLTVLLRLVFLLYAEDRELMPEVEPYEGGLSVNDLFEQLQADDASFPDAMSRRFGAWPRLLALFRCVFEGARHGKMVMPARRGELFDPESYPFLEGWSAGGAPVDLDARARLNVPTVDDETIYRVLKRLVVLEGQRLSYRALDVEQIGSVYEALMGYHVQRLTGPGVCLKPGRVWVSGDEVLEKAPAQRAKWLEELSALEPKAAKAVAESLKKADDVEAVLEALEPWRVKGVERAKPGRLVLQPGEERRRTSSHYTPRSLSAPIVRRALEPLLAAMGKEPSSERLLNLKICDPAMGSGAFLVEACRFLADQVVAAWTREGLLERESGREDVTMRARRLVAQRCLYGVDKNPFAVTLAKLSLWLVTLAREEPFTFLDHALKAGDSLVGLSLEQVCAFHWAPEEQMDLAEAFVRRSLAEALKHRQQILQMALDYEGPKRLPKQTQLDPALEKQRLLRLADEALEDARAIADLCLGAFFACDSDRAREIERKRRRDLVGSWLAEGGPMPAELRELRTLRGFHWMLEFPEVFHGKRPDPLDGEQTNKAAWMDAFVGNPPFMGKNGIAAMGGSYLPWLQTLHEGAHGNADYSAHFFRRAWFLLGNHGTMGLIATNTIAQGDTRSSGLQPLLAAGGVIYDATRSMKWPVDGANVSVSVVHVAKGHVTGLELAPVLDGRRTKIINSRLRAKPERPDPRPLEENKGKSFQGSIVLGMGFVLTPQRRAELAALDPRNGERIFRYIGGEEINSDPDPTLERYVINFGEMSLEEAATWPQLLEIVRRDVKPERDALKDNADGRRRKQNWWQFGRYTPAMFAALRPLTRCLVTARTSKHLAFSRQATGPVFSENAVVFALGCAALACLQSRVHLAWVRLTSSTLEDRQGYRPSDCFETFPFPSTPALSNLDPLGERLDAERGAWMTSQSQGLTTTYNRLKDPTDTTPGIVRLRALHEAVDRAVLDAYGWSDIAVPPYCGATPAQLETFEDEVLDRLFDLNAQRARPPPDEKKKSRAKKRSSTAPT